MIGECSIVFEALLYGGGGTMEVKLSSGMPRNICNCIYHCNVNLTLETLHANIPDIFLLHSDQLVKDFVCEIKNRTCMSSNCDLCKEILDHKLIDVVPIAKLKLVVKWFNLENNKYHQREKN